ncbi:MAG TPA: DUF6036 family nucleotidyltransferase [Isosphaeraceae bacterium]|jgi:hypothetical protein|nr:DUF6036 family nucleotidyltransferase [Isosphaeraceae bacterium]
MADDPILDFLKAVDDELARHAEEGERLDLHLLGRSALILGYSARLMTKDVDVVEVAGSRLLGIAVRVFGKGGPGHRAWGFYLETVSSGLPPLPLGYQSRCIDVPGPWSVIRPKRPEAHDLVISKLRRFHLGDREDVQILCDAGDLSPATLRERIDLAFAFHADEDEDPHRKKAYSNLRIVIAYLEGKRRGI